MNTRGISDSMSVDSIFIRGVGNIANFGKYKSDDYRFQLFVHFVKFMGGNAIVVYQKDYSAHQDPKVSLMTPDGFAQCFGVEDLKRVNSLKSTTLQMTYESLANRIGKRIIPAARIDAFVSDYEYGMERSRHEEQDEPFYDDREEIADQILDEFILDYTGCGVMKMDPNCLSEHTHRLMFWLTISIEGEDGKATILLSSKGTHDNGEYSRAFWITNGEFHDTSVSERMESGQAISVRCAKCSRRTV